jgi:hypothetical protein
MLLLSGLQLHCTNYGTGCEILFIDVSENYDFSCRRSLRKCKHV